MTTASWHGTDGCASVRRAGRKTTRSCFRTRQTPSNTKPSPLVCAFHSGESSLPVPRRTAPSDSIKGGY
eukprot:4856206-Prymnesium_polylepis.1